MRLRQALKNKKILFVGFILLMTLMISSISYADSDSPDVTMVDGKIVFRVETKAASSSSTIRYRTTGFTISMSPQTKMVSVNGIQGPDNPPTPNEYLPLLESEKEEVIRTKEKVITEFRISETRVKAAIKEIVDLEDLSENTYIYLNASFETYQIVNDKEIKRKTDIKTWRDIVNAESWADPNIFEPYFNIPVLFEPGPQDNRLFYMIVETETPKGALNSQAIGSLLYWNERVTSTTTLGDATYNLVGYYAKSNLTGKETARKMVSDSISVNDIINDSVTVLYGGMDIYMIYEPGGSDIVIDARDIDTDEDIKSDLYTGFVEPGDDFSQSIDNIITVNGITYAKTKHFYYLYVRIEEGLHKIRGETAKDDEPISFQVPFNLRTPGKITVKAYYKRVADGTIPVTVKAINKDTGAEISTITTGAVSSGGTYNYTVSEAISSGGKNYGFTGEWKWQYTKNTSTSPTITASGSGKDISFMAPSADDIKDGITVNVYYTLGDTMSDEISLRVIMVSGSGSFIEEISSETVTRGQAISKQIYSHRAINGLVYQYLNRWDYTYTTSTGNTTRASSTNPISFTVPTTTKLGTVITLKLYYDAKQSVQIPEAASPIVLSLDSPSPYAIINGDRYSQPYFFSKDGISTTESQYVAVRTKEYLLGYRLVNKTGIAVFNVPVTMTYTLEYFTATPEEFGGPIPVTEVVTDTQDIMVERAYSYWEIEKLEYYTPSHALIYNYSLPDEKVNLVVNGSYINLPSLSTRHSSRREDHYVLPAQAVEGIQLTYETPITSETSDRPIIEYEDLTAYAFEMTDELMVKNDYLSFNGSTVMTDSLSEMITQAPNASPMKHSSRTTHDKVLYTEGMVVDALKRNGVYPSNGSVTYARHPMSVNAYADSKYFSMPINDVIIHTPVACKPIINSDNDMYVQLINPTEGAYHMVLDADTSLNDFTVRISNTLSHSPRIGYYERDFSRSFIDPEDISYIAKNKGIVRNEMKLPFDVYIDTLNDKDPSNDEIIKAGTWIVLGRNTYRFYVPMWVREGTYTAQFRTVAVNGEDRIDNTETTKNSNMNSYVATDTRTFQISGRMYGLTLYDVSDEGRWRDAFRVKDSNAFKLFEGAEDGTQRTKYHDDYAYYYTVGIKNQYGYQNGRYERFTFPLINGSHPKYKNVGVIKTGYAFRFMLDTTGEMYASGSKIRIIPSFYHVDEKGNNRQPVDIYYDEEFYDKQHYLVKIGQGIDLANLQQGLVGNPYSKIPEAELRHTARVMDTTYTKIKSQFGTMYSYSDIRVTSQFRTFVGLNYASHISSLPSFTKVKEKIRETELSLSRYMQRWYGTYKLPTDLHVVPAGYDVTDRLRKYGIDYHEDFWLKDGYIIVNFNIESYDMDGNRQLSYTNGYNYLNNGHCSMWVMEGGAVEKKDNTGAAFRLMAGDVAFYFTSKKHSDDYTGRLY